MSDKPAKLTVENIPSIAGDISAIGSANAPFVYFEDAKFYGLINGIGKVALTSSRQIALSPEGVLFDHVIVAHLVGNLQAIRSLRAALDGIILMAEPIPEGAKN
jgi:hypothetical protein